MAINMTIAGAYVEKKYPNKDFSPAQIARIYLQESGGVVFGDGKGSVTTNPVNGNGAMDTAMICPKCERKMVRFPLCSSCAAAKMYKAIGVWVCPASVGLDQDVNLDENNGKVYRDYFILTGQKYEKVCCDQGIEFIKRGEE